MPEGKRVERGRKKNFRQQQGGSSVSIQSRINVSIFGNWFVWIQKTTLTYAVVISYVSRGWGVFYNEDILGGRAKTKESNKTRTEYELSYHPLAFSLPQEHTGGNNFTRTHRELSCLVQDIWDIWKTGGRMKTIWGISRWSEFMGRILLGVSSRSRDIKIYRNSYSGRTVSHIWAV